MNIYIFEYMNQVAVNRQEPVGLVVVAKNIEHVKELIDSANGTIRSSDLNFDKVITYPLMGEHEARILSFPDSGFFG